MSLIQKYAVAAVAILLSMVVAPAYAAIFIDFEDLASGFVPTSYNGLTWSGGFGSGSWVVSLESDDIFLGTEAHSQDHYSWSNGGIDLSISGGPFTLNSLWARVPATSGTAIAHGFLGSTELFTQTLNLAGSYQLFTLNFVGIDSWTLTDQDNNTLIDDITLNDNVAAVPEASSMIVWTLLALTICGACWWKRAKLAA
jgi:hypothetical protein